MPSTTRGPDKKGPHASPRGSGPRGSEEHDTEPGYGQLCTTRVSKGPRRAGPFTQKPKEWGQSTRRGSPIRLQAGFSPRSPEPTDFPETFNVTTDHSPSEPRDHTPPLFDPSELPAIAAALPASSLKGRASGLTDSGTRSRCSFRVASGWEECRRGDRQTDGCAPRRPSSLQIQLYVRANCSQVPSDVHTVIYSR